jgi:hypothetical protein
MLCVPEAGPDVLGLIDATSTVACGARDAGQRQRDGDRNAEQRQ